MVLLGSHLSSYLDRTLSRVLGLSVVGIGLMLAMNNGVSCI